MAVATREFGLFINGETVEPLVSRASWSSRQAAEPFGTAQLAGEAVDRAVAAARAALDGAWGRTRASERSRLLHALADAIPANRNELAELEARNVGKAISSVKAEARRRRRELSFLRLRGRAIAGRSNPLGASLLSTR